VNDEAYELAAILATDDPGELYSALSVLVSTTVDGGPCAALLSFGALALMLDMQIGVEREGEWAPWAHDREAFWRSLYELKRTAIELDGLKLWACSASIDTIKVAGGKPFDGIMSTPRFLRETAGARRFIHV
jgi:hypothetical protein